MIFIFFKKGVYYFKDSNNDKIIIVIILIKYCVLGIMYGVFYLFEICKLFR